MSVLHLVRHGRIPDYKTDQPLTLEGQQEVIAAGQELGRQIQPGEIISFYSSPTRRTRQTARLLHNGLSQALEQSKVQATIIPAVTVDDRLQNCQFYLDGLAYDPIQPLFEVARWRLQQTGLPDYKACVAFHTGFWNSSDPMAYWLTHPHSAIEAPQAVSQRVRDCLAEQLAAAPARRTICVTHSANLRAFLQTVFGYDPGEPPFCGMATISGTQVRYQEQVGTF